VRAATVKLVGELDGTEFQAVLKAWRDDVIRKLASEGRAAKAGEYTKYIDYLVKVYVEKYGAGSVSDKSREEIIRDLERGLEDWRKGALRNIWDRVSRQIEGLMAGLREAEKRNALEADTVADLIRSAGRETPPQALQALRAILDPGLKGNETLLFKRIFTAAGKRRKC
jgi:hypothetical protein